MKKKTLKENLPRDTTNRPIISFGRIVAAKATGDGLGPEIAVDNRFFQ